MAGGAEVAAAGRIDGIARSTYDDARALEGVELGSSDALLFLSRWPPLRASACDRDGIAELAPPLPAAVKRARHVGIETMLSG